MTQKMNVSQNRRRTDAFDLDTRNAPIEVIIPEVIPVIAATMSPAGNDATLVLRVTTMLTHAWFDAIAPYHPTAVGVSSRLCRRPVHEANDRHRNIALLSASVPVLTSLFPARAEQWQQLVSDVLPEEPCGEDAEAVTVGRAAGLAVVADRTADGMNQLGDGAGRRYHVQPYADTTGYAPINAADELVDPSRWQPLSVADRVGIYRSQRFVTPQMAVTRPYSYPDPAAFDVPAPTDSHWQYNPHAYRTQAEHVLSVSAALDEKQKLIAELFDNKINGLGFSALFAAQSRGLDLTDFVHYDFLTNLAAFDAAIAVWHHKRRFDAVRPVTAIGFLFGEECVTAWGGPGAGTVSDLPAVHWRSYLATADHPEYPSASTALCHAHAGTSRRYFGTDELNWTVTVPQGASTVEPGVTPAQPRSLHFATWSDLADACGSSRVWGGVHFQPAVTAGAELGREVGEAAWQFVSAHIAGTAPQPAEPATGLSGTGLSGTGLSGTGLSGTGLSGTGLSGHGTGR